MIAPADRISNQDVCDADKIRKLLTEEISEAELNEFAKHLNHCDACRRALDYDTGSDEQWHASVATVRSQLVQPEDDTNLSLCHGEIKAGKHIPSLVSWLRACDKNASEQGFIGELDMFLVRRVVGTGGMGVVLEGWDRQLQRPIAIKAMHPHLASIGVARQRFIREARAAAVVAHPNVVPIHCINENFDPPYLVMPLVAGESLQTRIDRIGALDVGAALRIASQIADGLTAAHGHGLIHRDIKPANILLEWGTERALITDFGVVRALDEATMTASGSIAGTPEYMSPEQAIGGAVDFRSDLFSLGSVLYTMLSGRSPFRADSALGVLRRVTDDQPRSLATIDPHLPPWLIALVHGLHQKSASDRPSTSSEIAVVLRNALAHWNSPQTYSSPKLKPNVGARQRALYVRWGVAALALFGLISVGLWNANNVFQWVGQSTSPDESNFSPQLGKSIAPTSTDERDLEPDEWEQISGIEIEKELKEIESQMMEFENAIQE